MFRRNPDVLALAAIVLMVFAVRLPIPAIKAAPPAMVTPIRVQMQAEHECIRAEVEAQRKAIRQTVAQSIREAHRAVAESIRLK
jgi:hypothetical protein